MHRKKINISTVFAGQNLGIKEVDEGIWLVSFMQYDLGYIAVNSNCRYEIRGCSLRPDARVAWIEF